MKHLGDITKISGYTAPIVDCIIGGSPCQDLSMAGKRAGLDGERSGLYIEQVRIVKEMRKQDELNGRSDVDIRPRYMVWENVPGAFSSNKGEDFRIVLEELAKVKDENAVIPMPDKGKWTNSGCIMGDGWSIAWRVLDAQFWGVPQRRRRIALVADFGGSSAPEILFVRKSVSGHTDESEPKRKEASSDASGGIGADDRSGVYCFEPGAAKRLGGYVWEDLAPTLRTEVGDNRPSVAYGIDHAITTGGNCTAQGSCIYEDVQGTLKASGPHKVCYGISSYNSNGMKSDNPHSGIYEASTSRTLDLNGGNPTCNQGGIAIVESVPYTLKIRSGCEGGGKGALVQENKSATLATNNDQYLFQPLCIIDSIGGQAERGWEGKVAPCLKSSHYKFAPSIAYSVENHPADSRVDIDESGKVQTLTSRMGTGGGNVPMVLALDRASFNQGKNAQFDFEISDKGINSSLVAKGPSAVCYSVDQGGGKSACNVTEGQAPTLTCTHGGEPAVCYSLQGGGATSQNSQGIGYTEDKSYTLNTIDRHAVCYKQAKAVDCRNGTENETNGALQSGAFRSLNCNNVVRQRYIVRRLTPLECERLQGYPDNWTRIGEVVGYERQIDEGTGEEFVQAIYEYIDANGKKRKTSDAARYKALGNSISIPNWKWVLKKLCACYERDATMASLFDGIGGFPYIWEQLNGKGSCLWASEIEEFPIAVTKVRIGE